MTGATSGAVVAVCGLTGGAGTTTIAWSLAAHAASDGGKTLIAELPTASGGIIAATGVATTRTLGTLLERSARGAGGSAAPAFDDDGLAVMAGPPERLAPLHDEALRGALSDVVADLRARYPMVVLDCGTIAGPDARAAVELASHIVWVVAAHRDAAERAERVLGDGLVAPPPGSAAEILVAVASRPPARVGGARRALRALAATRCDRLVLVPYVRRLDLRRDARGGSRELGSSLSAIAGAIRPSAVAAVAPADGPNPTVAGPPVPALDLSTSHRSS